MQTLVVYDNDGFVLYTQQGSELREPVGVPFLWIEVPRDKRVANVDVSTTPHQAVLEKLPPTEIELLRVEMARSNTELFEMMLMMNGGV